MIPNAHPAASLFPLLDGAELAALAEDVRMHGLHDPITLLDGLVLDGRNRLAACALVDVEPRFVDFDGDDPAAWVVSRNLHRRHLTESQRAMVGASLVAYYAEDATKRRLAAQNNDTGRAVRATLPEQGEWGRARDAAAASVHVSPRSVESASVVRRDGTAALVAAVERGRVAVSVAAELATLPVDEQRVVVDLPEREILARAKEIKAARSERRRAAFTERIRAAADEAEPIAGIDLRCESVEDMLVAPGRVDFVHADSPWCYDNQRLNGTVGGHYLDSPMTPIVDALTRAYEVAAEDCYLLLWCTWPMLMDWAAPSSEMPWHYLSGAAWIKEGGPPGIGFHWRGRSEFALLYAKGEPKPWWSSPPLSAGVVAPVGEHSEKPADWLRECVETFVPPGGCVLDLYAGLAPMARACRAAGRSYRGAEIDPTRHARALLALGEGP